jgi:putative tricarboxylic transport membrane protein
MKDIVAGLLFIVIGVFFKYHSQTYSLGSVSNMGPGYFPDLISTLLLVVGIVLTIKSLIWKS